MLRFPRNDIYAFTLAEVLVTLGIIGVVSAMTVPSLMQNYQRQSYVTQLSKVYNEFQQAFMKYINDKNAIDLTEGGLTSVASVQTFMSDYFRVVQKCTLGTFDPCFNKVYTNMNGTTLGNGNYWAGVSAPCYVLASGASICIERVNYHSLTIGDTAFPYGHITIDVNGPKGPNIAGRDLFFVTYYADGSIDEDGIPQACHTDGKCGSSKTNAKDVRTAIGASCKSRGDAKGCFGLILNDNWQMTY